MTAENNLNKNNSSKNNNEHLILIKLASEGDEVSLKVLYDIFGTTVYNVALSYLQNENDAEEITQDVFIEVFSSSSKFKSNSSVKTWIYKIAVNKSIDRLRFLSRKKRFALFTNLFNNESENPQNEISDFTHPGTEIEDKEKSNILFKAINRLNERQKTSFILTYIEDLTIKETGEIMNISPKAVESLLQRAKTSLRKELINLYR